MKKKILFICGSINQTKQMHQIADELPEYEHAFTPYFGDGILEGLRRLHLVEFSILGNKHMNRCLRYLEAHQLRADFRGRSETYDLVITCSDLVMPHSIRHRRVVLVQEGMTDPENFLYALTRAIPLLPRWIASTATTGLSHLYDRFCVASDGYRDLFIRKGVDPRRIVVTGIPNFDNCAQYLRNSFPHRNYVLVCTSDARETFKWENRRAFIRRAVAIAAGRPLIFKLHPNERADRATREIARHAPGALVYATGNTEEMVANCDVLITRYSSVVYVGLALGKEVYSGFDVQQLRGLTPLQNASAARNISRVCRDLVEDAAYTPLASPAAERPLRQTSPVTGPPAGVLTRERR